MDDFAAVADKYMKMICDYTVQKYVGEIDSSFDECPHKTDFEDADMAFKQVTLVFVRTKKFLWQDIVRRTRKKVHRRS